MKDPRAVLMLVLVDLNGCSTGKCGKWFHGFSPRHNELIERFDYMLQLVDTRYLLSYLLDLMYLSLIIFFECLNIIF